MAKLYVYASETTLFLFYTCSSTAFGVSGEVNLSVAVINLAITWNSTNADNTHKSKKRTDRVY
jgi:hypothetical protein